MAFPVKNWQNEPAVATPISDAALEDMETRLSDYTDDGVTSANAYTDTGIVAANAFTDALTGGVIVYPEQFNPTAGTGGNDATALRACMDAIEAAGGGTLRLRDNTTYLVNSAPDTSKGGYALLPLPNLSANTFPYIRIQGNGNSKIKTTLTNGAYSATYGIPSVIGGPTEENAGTGLLSSTVIIDGVRVEVPGNSPTFAGVDLLKNGRAAVYHTRIETTGDHTVVVAGTSSYAFGLRMPGALKLGMSRIQEVLCTGYYCGFALQGGHQHMAHTNVKWCRVGYGIVDQANADPHISPWLHVQSQWCKHHLAGWDKDGVKSTPTARPFLIFGSWDIEDADPGGANSQWAVTWHIVDANAQIAGELRYNMVLENTGVVSGPPTISTAGGAKNLRLMETNPTVVPSVASAATITLPKTREFVNVTGTTTITNITSAWIGRHVTLQFSGALTLTHGTGNLRLSGAANVAVTANDVIQLVCDGTDWHQCAPILVK